MVRLQLENQLPYKIRYWPCHLTLERHLGNKWEDVSDGYHTVPPPEDRPPGWRNPLYGQCVLVTYRLPPYRRHLHYLELAKDLPEGEYRFQMELIYPGHRGLGPSRAFHVAESCQPK